MKNKKIIALIICVVLVIAIVFAITRINENKKRKTTFENETATSDVVLKKLEFKNITKTFENGVTTIRADVYNNTKDTKNINVEIILKDSNGQKLKSMIQVIEGIKPNSKKILQTGILGNYSNVDNIEFKILSDAEIEQYNK